MATLHSLTITPISHLVPGISARAVNLALREYDSPAELGYALDAQFGMGIYHYPSRYGVGVNACKWLRDVRSEEALANHIRDALGRRAARQLWESWLDQHGEQLRRSRDMRALLRHPAGRVACREAAEAGKAYSAKAEEYATRPVVRQAVRLLAERLAHKQAAQRQAVEPGRIARLALERRLARTRRAVLAAADYRTARNGHDDTVEFGPPCADSDTGKDWDVYRGSFKGWAATTSRHTYTVPQDWLETVAARGLANVDGLLTLSAEPVAGHGPELYRAVWVEQGRGTALKTVRGYIAREGTTSYHGATAASALTGLRRKLGQLSPRRAIDLGRYGHVPVTLADSLAAGNCEGGTTSWCYAVGINPNGTATIAEVIAGYKIRPMGAVLAVIRHAVKNHRQWEKLLSEPRGNVRFDAEGGWSIER